MTRQIGEEKHHSKENIRNQTRSINPHYYESVCKDEPKFLTNIRRWEKEMGFLTSIYWTRVMVFFVLHILTLCGIVYFVTGKIMWQTFIFEFLWGAIAGFGVTAGVHRYWTHRSFKAKWPLQIILLIAFSMARQDTIIDWVLDHRLHHKMSETTADPHDASRGFFFSHIGWLMMAPHPHVLEERRKIDISDLMEDSLVMFHTRYFRIFEICFCTFLPFMIPVFYWEETWTASFLAGLVRYVLTLHFTWAVNSFAHLWGNKPYDINIMPVENWQVSLFSMGEGWHNYHHTFPWDYKAAELPHYINVTTLVLHMFASLGWAYDMKKASSSLVKSVINNRGPGKLSK